MGDLWDTLGDKKPGYLVRSEDWNNLVLGVEKVESDLTAYIDSQITELGTRLDERIDAVNTGLTTRIEEVDSRLSGEISGVSATVLELQETVARLSEELSTLRSRVEPLLTEYYRVTLETTKPRYAVGELALITARVTDLEGNPLPDLSNPNNRPWVDFVTPWGQLKAVDRSVSRAGAGEKTISVRTDQNGVAQVHLRSEHAGGFSDEEEDVVASALTTRIQALNATVGDRIASANTPTEAKNDGVFRIMTMEYDRTDTSTFRRYVDAHYLRDTIYKDTKLNPNIFGNWRDYRSTVMAFAKRDADPLTPDQSRGAGSIQVTFRDWVGPWITLEYLPEIDNTRVLNIRDLINDDIRVDYGTSLGLITDHVVNQVRDKGEVGKLREYKMVQMALDLIPEAGDRAQFLGNVVDTTREAIDVEIGQKAGAATFLGVASDTDEIAFKAHTRSAARSDAEVSGVKTELNNVGAGIDSRISAAVTAQVDSLQQEGGALDVIHKQVAQVSGDVGELVNLAGDGNVSTIKQRLDTVRALDERLDLFLRDRV